MIPSSRANPNSVPAANARMASIAAIRAADRRAALHAPVPAAVDAKCVVRRIGGVDLACRLVDVTDRSGRDLILRLHLKDDALVPALRAAMDAGRAVEIVYAASTSRGMIAGDVLAVH